MRLTKRAIESLPSPARDEVLWDDVLTGFGLRLKPSGAKSFIVQYRNRYGRSRRLTIGKYGVFAPEQARSEAKRALADVARGLDPLDQKQSERRTLTVAQLCAEYLDKAQAGAIMTRRGRLKKSSTLYTDKGRIARHIVPLLGNRSVKDVGFADVNRFLADVIAGKTKADIKTKLRGRAIVKGGRGTGARTLGLLGGIFT
ncbi:MAG TPA: Arm DNA-binding domain-containing protein [Prosthecobacter sp.]|nr:Arm DNA-binding domain-containing protein [Prosthecobacter sp.]